MLPKYRMQRYILLSVEAKYYNVMPKINVDKKQQKVTCTSISPLLVVTTVVLYILHYKQANTSTHTHINILTYYTYNIYTYAYNNNNTVNFL